MVKHEEELRRMKEYYSQHRDLIKKVQHWESAWRKYLDFEVFKLIILYNRMM